MEDLRRKRQQVTSFLLRQGRSYAGRTTWSGRHRRWLAEQTFDHPEHQLVLQEAVDTAKEAEARLDRLGAALAEIVPTWSMAPVVAAYQAMRGVNFLGISRVLWVFLFAGLLAFPFLKRYHEGEIGVRRSFGATSARVFFAVMMESVVATVVAPFHWRATPIGRSRTLNFLISSLVASNSNSDACNPACRFPDSIAIVAGTAPWSRTICSICLAVSRFFGRGNPCAITVDSSATTGWWAASASRTSSFSLTISFII